MLKAEIVALKRKPDERYNYNPAPTVEPMMFGEPSDPDPLAKLCADIERDLVCGYDGSSLTAESPAPLHSGQSPADRSVSGASWIKIVCEQGCVSHADQVIAADIDGMAKKWFCWKRRDKIETPANVGGCHGAGLPATVTYRPAIKAECGWCGAEHDAAANHICTNAPPLAFDSASETWGKDRRDGALIPLTRPCIRCQKGAIPFGAKEVVCDPCRSAAWSQELREKLAASKADHEQALNHWDPWMGDE